MKTRQLHLIPLKITICVCEKKLSSLFEFSPHKVSETLDVFKSLLPLNYDMRDNLEMYKFHLISCMGFLNHFAHIIDEETCTKFDVSFSKIAFHKGIIIEWIKGKKSSDKYRTELKNIELSILFFMDIKWWYRCSSWVTYLIIMRYKHRHAAAIMQQ